MAGKSRYLQAVAALLAAFCLFCDLIARTAFAPRDMSISSVTAVFGAPVVLCLMASRRGGREGRL